MNTLDLVASTTQELVAAGLQLPIMEAFYTIQGEGRFTGHPAYFIRLGGCDVGCVWCDVKESWEAAKWPVLSIEKIVEDALAFPGRLVVITGGEPLMYNMDPLTKLLKEHGFTTNIETSGAHPFSGDFDWVCFSPKKFKKPHPSIFAEADELKVVIYNKSDYEFAEQYAGLVNESCELRLQPEWSKAVKITAEIIDFVKNHPKWNISLQTHKFMDIP
ncbi:7-carboxy-7-deazaguanine synthase QueE [Algoriphagus sp.]|jgi:organic radical activating enzyme|uniref:7-carboxy-7-deazaguanine synthase QueE n=1 Tax=Algoriphagus sp. TaxID=1872435 RepID=UPI00271DFF09|nr:7-carboxy-7-deazaguanine synthase QueE [Algoriphagus sp.]MDO8967957.1 7-carboxy-7-deazaguanine synthase QueE [Algoriphagus sp.]MDP3200479.1 7-carboxy-7-deazaguanine synthase QueE [Algoriphagus sp.]